MGSSEGLCSWLGCGGGRLHHQPVRHGNKFSSLTDSAQKELSKGSKPEMWKLWCSGVIFPRNCCRLLYWRQHRYLNKLHRGSAVFLVYCYSQGCKDSQIDRAQASIRHCLIITPFSCAGITLNLLSQHPC